MANQITILGAGSMGTACATLLAEQPECLVRLWARNPVFAAAMMASRENSRLLPGVRIPDSVLVTANPAEALDATNLIVVCIPTKGLRESATHLASEVPPDVPMVSAIKGIENHTLLRPSQILTELYGPRSIAALGGPCHAEEMARRLPASVVAASIDTDLAERVQRVFSNDRFRVYTNTDIAGVELAGAVKNVIAIAAGICDGLKYGDNARSALIARGLVEISRFGQAMGAEPETFAGLAGVGDLIATCGSQHSRNRRVGQQLGEGQSLQEIQDSMSAVAEGVNTTRSVIEIAEQRGFEMPIAREVYNVLFENKSPRQATDDLMNRPHRSE